jgi:hypothetical protein
MSGRNFKGFITFPDLKFTATLLDKESKEFKDLAKEIWKLFVAIYKERIDGFMYLEILSFKKDEKGLVCELKAVTSFESRVTADYFESITLQANEVGNVGEFKMSLVSFIDMTKQVEPKRRQFVVYVIIQNKEFTEGLKNLSSPEFKNMSREFEAALNVVYRKIKGFLYTRVISFAKGSIVCNFRIITTVESKANETFLINILRRANVSDNLAGFILKNKIIIKELEAKTKSRERKLEDWMIGAIATACLLVVVMFILVIACVSILNIIQTVRSIKPKIHLIKERLSNKA